MSGSAMVFTHLRETSRRLAFMLRNLGLSAVPINGKMAMPKRLGALNKFRSGDCNILVATDLACKGLDIPSVDMVINYDIPCNPKNYIHRVGRTARARRSGVAISLVDQYELSPFLEIENMIGKKLPTHPAEEEEVMLLLDRVVEADRISRMMNKESGGVRKRKQAGNEEEEEIQKYMRKGHKFSKPFKKRRL